MRLVLAAPLYPPEAGGPATYAKLLEDGLPGEGIEVVLVKFSDVRHLPAGIRHYAYYRRIVNAARHADAVLALDPVSVGLPSMLAARRVRKPFFVKIVGDYAWEQGRQRFGVTEDLDAFVRTKQSSWSVRCLQYVERRVAQNAARIIVPSYYLKSVLNKGWGMTDTKIAVIYNAVFRESAGTLPAAVAQFQRPFVASVGRLVPWKRVEGVIDAVARVPAFGLVVVGEGPESAALRARAKEKLGSQAVFTGALPHAETLAVMKESAAVVLNSTYEGLSHVLIEAQALGAPVIATDAGGNPEVVRNNVGGLIYKTSDENGLTNALADFASSDMQHLKEGALKSSERFSLATMLRETARVLKETP